MCLFVLLVVVFESLTARAYVYNKKWNNTPVVVTFYANDDIAYGAIYAFGDAAYTWNTTSPYAVSFSYGGVISVDSTPNVYDGNDVIIAYQMPEFGHAIFSGEVETFSDVLPQYASQYTEVTMYKSSKTEPRGGR